MDPARKIADAVLYEGYLLWPYRRSAVKNQQRWTFGGVYPEAHSRPRGGDDPWTMQTQCLLEGDDDTTVDVGVRFLQVVERQVGRLHGGGLEFVDELTLGDQRHLAWDEAAEREVLASDLRVADMKEPTHVGIHIPAGEEREELRDPAGASAGAIVRSWRSLEGAVEVRCERLDAGLFKVTVHISNTTPWAGGSREDALRSTFASTHTTLRAHAGEFVSLTDPPPELRPAAEGCRNTGTWPVLVGEEGDRHVLLSSPIILSDYPEVAPESPGDLFDGGEIDELLTLNILSLTDEEKREMRDSDPRAREILERTESLTGEELMRLHGAIRELQVRQPW